MAAFHILQNLHELLPDSVPSPVFVLDHTPVYGGANTVRLRLQYHLTQQMGSRIECKGPCILLAPPAPYFWCQSLPKWGSNLFFYFHVHKLQSVNIATRHLSIRGEFLCFLSPPSYHPGSNLFDNH